MTSTMLTSLVADDILDVTFECRLLDTLLAWINHDALLAWINHDALLIWINSTLLRYVLLPLYIGDCAESNQSTDYRLRLLNEAVEYHLQPRKQPLPLPTSRTRPRSVVPKRIWPSSSLSRLNWCHLYLARVKRLSWSFGCVAIKVRGYLALDR